MRFLGNIDILHPRTHPEARLPSHRHRDGDRYGWSITDRLVRHCQLGRGIEQLHAPAVIWSFPALPQHLGSPPASVGLARVHWTWISVLCQHRPHRALWLAVLEKRVGDRWGRRRLYCRRSCWVHRRQQHLVRTCDYVHLGSYFQASCVPTGRLAGVGSI